MEKLPENSDLDLTGLTPEQLLGLKEQVDNRVDKLELKPVERQKFLTRQRLRRWFITAGITLGLGAGAIAAKPHIEEVLGDIAIETAQRAANREVDERMDAIRIHMTDFLGLVTQDLYPALDHFIITLQSKMDNYEDLSKLGSHLYEGLKGDAVGFFANWTDTSPDSLFEQMNAFVMDDEELKAAYEQLTDVAEKIQEWVLGLPEFAERQTEVTDADRKEALEDAKDVAGEVIREKLDDLNPFTSAQPEESQE